MPKTLALGVVAVCTWMFVAPKTLPAHRILATFIVVVVVGLFLGVLLPEK